MNMKRILAVLLASLMIFSLAACGTSAPANQSTITNFSASYGENFDDAISINLFPDEANEGKFMLYYGTGMDMNQGITDGALAETLTKLFNESKLQKLNGKNEYEDGDAVGSMSILFADGSTFDCSFGGKIPADFATAFEKMDAAASEASQTAEPYKAQVEFADDVNADAKAALNAVFAHLSNQAVESNMGTNLPVDNENFAYSIGINPEQAAALNAQNNVENATVVMNMMGTVAHNIALFQMKDGADAAAFQQTLLNNADWRKWVCVAPDLALTATKDNYVLFAMTLNAINDELTPALEAEGWTVTNTVENPDLAE